MHRPPGITRPNQAQKALVNLCIVLIALLLVISSAFTDRAQAANLAKFEPPDGYVYSGAGARLGTFHTFDEEMAIDVGKWPAMRLVFYSWGVSFPMDPAYEDSIYNIHREGMIPVLTWEPFGVSLSAIANGSQDAYIDSWAQAAKATGKPIFLRFAHEMNGNWYPWAGNTTNYVAAWRHIVDRFRAAGADNVAFVWCVSWENRGPAYDLYYPGDAYVDWVGVDLYNWPRWPRTFDYMVSAFYSDYAGRKPIMIGEMASAENFTPDPGYENPAAQNKSVWITQMFNDMNTKYPAIKGFCWFNLIKETDWRVESSPSALAAYKAGVASPRYLGRDDLNGSLPTPTPTPTPTPGYNVSMTHRWASYNGTNAPIEQFAVVPNTTVAQSIYLVNTGSATDQYNLSIAGLPSSWYTITWYGSSTLSPGQGRYANAYITPLAEGAYTFTITAASLTDPAVTASQTYTVHVSAAPPPPGVYNVTVTDIISYYNGTWAPIEDIDILPNTSVLTRITYQNTGNVTDSYAFSISGVPPEWCSVDPGDPNSVAPGESRTLNATLVPHAPGIYTARLTITSAGNPAVNYTQICTVYVLNNQYQVGPYGVSMVRRNASYGGASAPLETFQVVKGTTISQGILYRNIGLNADSYTVSVSGIPGGWYNISMNGPVVVPPNGERNGSLNITPLTAGNYTFAVRAISVGDPQVFDSDTYTLQVVNTSVPSGYNVTTTHRWASYNGSSKPIEQFVIAPGTTVSQSVYYVNTGSRPDSYNVSVSGISAGWWTFMLYGNATVLPGEGRYGNVFITPTAAGNYTFTVKLASNGDPAVYSSQTYTMHVSGAAPPSGYNVTTTHRWASYNGSSKPIEQFRVRPNTTVAQSVYYNNTGTQPDSYNVSVSGIPENWWTFTLYGNATVLPHEGRYGNVYITPASAGNYTFTVTVTSRGDPSVSSNQSYTLYVAPSGYNVTTTHRWATYNGSGRPIEQFLVRPGTTVAQSVYYNNTGSLPDSYNVSVSGIPAGWWTFALYGNATVRPGEGRYGNVYITPATAGNYTLTVAVRSNGDPSVASTQIYTMHAG